MARQSTSIMQPQITSSRWTTMVVSLLVLVAFCCSTSSGFTATDRRSTVPPQALRSSPARPGHPFQLAQVLPSSSTSLSMATKGALVKNSLVKGKITLILSKFLIGPGKWWHIVKRLVFTIQKDFLDLALVVFFWKMSLPLARKWYDRQHADLVNVNEDNESQQNKDRLLLRFNRSKTRRLAQVVEEVATLLGFLFGFEIGLTFLDELGFEFVRTFPVYSWMCGIVASVWGAKNLSEFKEYVLTKGNRKDLRKFPGARLINRALDILIFGGTGVIILDFLSVQTGYAIRSLFGLSSIGTLVFSLASKELVSEFLASLAIQGTNMYTEGEKILLQDGTAGTVQKLGWLNTHLRRADELVVRIPNTKISGTRVANISRSRLSTVKQALAISHDDMDKLPALVKEIKQEIRDACPTLIEDGSRSFQVFFTDFKDKSIQVLVSAHFRTRPFSEAYMEVKQDVLLAITRATNRLGIKFSYVDISKEAPILLD